MNYYTLTAEARCDIAAFLRITNDIHIISIRGLTNYPDTDITFKSRLTYNQVQAVLQQVVDGHVMVRTLKSISPPDEDPVAI